jgi:hypothetical protein
MVYELSPSGSSLGMTLRTVIPLKSSAYDVALDVRRHIAYVACYDSGVAVVDMSDPYRKNPNNPYGLLDANQDGVDDRVLGYVQVSGGSRATLVVDSETGLLYIGDSGMTSGLKIVGQQKPRMEFLAGIPAGNSGDTILISKTFRAQSLPPGVAAGGFSSPGQAAAEGQV